MPENYFTSPGAPSFIPQGRGENAVPRSEVDINKQQETIVIDGEGQIENMGVLIKQVGQTPLDLEFRKKIMRKEQKEILPLILIYL